MENGRLRFQRTILFSLTPHITSRKKKSDGRATLFPDRVNVVVIQISRAIPMCCLFLHSVPLDTLQYFLGSVSLPPLEYIELVTPTHNHALIY